MNNENRKKYRSVTQSDLAYHAGLWLEMTNGKTLKDFMHECMSGMIILECYRNTLPLTEENGEMKDE